MPQKDRIVIDLSSDSDDEVANVHSPSATNSSFEMCPTSNSGETAKPASDIVTANFKYSNADTVSKKPTYFSLAWKQIWNGNEGRLDYEPFDENQTAKLASAKYGIVSTYGFLITWKGIEIAEHLAEEQKKRERVNDHDWSGSGVSEVMLNMLRDFNRDLFQKTMSPYNKWAYIEGLASFLEVGDLTNWAMCDDSSRIEAIVNEFGTMLLTCLELLSELNLFTPNSTVMNIPVVLLLMLKFLEEWKDLGYEIGWSCEIIRLCDEAGIDLEYAILHTSETIKLQVNLIGTWRKEYRKKQSGCSFAKIEPFNGNGYMYWASKENWQPKQDGLHLVKEFYQPDDPANYGQEEERRKWFRWDWKIEYPEFNKAYPGGSRRVLKKKVASSNTRRILTKKKRVTAHVARRISKKKVRK